ncbi:biotin-dependent carboxyltransferase family protein [Allorhizocola rhizosphaerae]|uniref:5-oxoprolinase subunit C family protein n=1 Tax=Allorhizocola rhizosphaerae TaxID=1872709 RepID=UPI000E3D815E|nr:biotin-dependent carboxyltransferase family protein [Allorhizocola rhizosphaerae]
MPELEVVAVGVLATVQDRGRVGYAHLGVPRSGAVDAPALALANRLLGNDSGAAGIELAYGRFEARFERPAYVAVAGAPAPVWVDGRPGAFGVPIRAGRSLRVGSPVAGVYMYIAVQGGVDVPRVLGSRSTDTLSGLGPAPLRAGDLVAFGDSTPAAVDFTPWSRGVLGEVRVRVRLGPRDDWFDDPGSLFAQPFHVGSANRIGVRLSGTPIARRRGELPSEGLVSGSIQVPGDGLPIVFLADHPTTGGYPVIGVVHPDDLPLLAQARTGARVVFCGP